MRKYPLYKPLSATMPRDLDKLMETYARRNADSVSASPITAQRLSPEVMQIFVKKFVLFDTIEKVPSNGLSHTFQQQTAFTQSSEPHTISETGTVSDDSNVYLRKTTNIAVFGERRGVTIKAQLGGGAAGGPSDDLMVREVEGGLTTLGRDAQMSMLRYQESDPGSTTATAANGKFDPNGMNGLRYILQNMAPPENNTIVDIRAAGWSDQRVLRAVRAMVNVIVDKGGEPDMIVTSMAGSEAMFDDQSQFARVYVKPNYVEVVPGWNVPAVMTSVGELPVLPVPGGAAAGGLGTWVDGNGYVYFDIFILQSETLKMPYLGAPEPTIIRVPIGTDGQLRELAIPYFLLGLAAEAPPYLGRVSCRIA